MRQRSIGLLVLPHLRHAQTPQRGQRHAARVTDYKHKGKVRVSLHQIEHLGHAWSGGPAKMAYSDADGPDATRLVWTFVARQFKAAQAAAPAPR